MSATGTTARAYSPSWRLVSVIVLRSLVKALIRNKWDGRENVPRRGAVILAVNHLSYLDFAPDGVFLDACGRYPVFMIKASAFEVKGIGGFLRKAGQVPVDRGSRDAALALSEAEKRLSEGAAVVFYPEGTTTLDRAGWPMAARTGVARLALATDVPVIPVAHWGTQDIVPYGGKIPRLFPRKTVRIVAGRPVDLSRWAGQQDSAKALHAATCAIMAEVTELVGQLRGETPPPVPYDPSNPAAAGPESMTKPLPETPPS
jgi:1-acyl-sn-glycerol-3-phosphate acyltransferase